MRINRLTIALALLLLIPAAVGAFFLFIVGDGGSAAPVSGDVAGVVQPWLDEQGAGSVSPAVTTGEAAGETVAPAVPEEAKATSFAARVQPSLSHLAAAQASEGAAGAERFAAERALKLTDGRVRLVVEAADPQVAAARVADAGGIIEATHDDLIQASVPVEQIEPLSEDPAVEYVREPETPSLATISEGVADIGAPAWHSAGGDGGGVKIAVIDLGFQGYPGLVTAGELPAGVTAVSFRTDGDITGGGESHGSACAEIVHDVAPGAQLYLVNFSTDVELANAIDYVVAQDVDVVSASWSFFGDFRGDGQGPIDDMVKGAHDAGIFWASVAGNAAQDHWSGGFTDVDSDTWNEFATGDDGNDINASAGTTINAYLTWNKWPVTDEDYDMYLYYEGSANAVAAGDGWQAGTQAPSENIHYTVPPGKSGRYWVAIRNYSASGDATFKLYTYPLHLQYQTPAGSLAGQPADSDDVMTIGAVPVGSSVLESFSSRGPTVDGRTKPDIVGPDRVTTSTYGYTNFWGTSAAAPHLAGAGALVAQAFPSYTPDQIQAYLEGLATDLGTPGKDNLFGSGRLDLGAPPDLTPPSITSVLPSGFVDSTSAIVSVGYSDSGSGVDTSSVTVSLDGSPLAGCTVTTTNASCPVSGLTGGSHEIGGSVTDSNGNSSPVSGSFYVTCFQPELAIGSPAPSWVSYQDYLNRELTITYSLCDTGANNAYNVNVVGAESTNGVLFISPVPVAAGDLESDGQPGACTTVSYRYLVPHGVESFKTVTYVTAESPCGDTFFYPGPYIGPGS